MPMRPCVSAYFFRKLTAGGTSDGFVGFGTFCERNVLYFDIAVYIGVDLLIFGGLKILSAFCYVFAIYIIFSSALNAFSSLILY
jgi:hypothetical protein